MGIQTVVVSVHTKKSMNRKYRDGEITWGEYSNYLANKPKPEKSMRQKWKDGDITHKQYDDFWARNLGFKDGADYYTDRNHRLGIKKPMSNNKECGQYLGIYIAERILSKVFENVTRMPNNNSGYDFICKKGYKIDVKSSLLHKRNTQSEYWNFSISYNTIADYFLFIGFDNLDDITPLNIWLIKGIDIVRGRALNKFSGLTITNTPESINQFKLFEKIDKLEKTIDCCKTLKERAGV